MDDQRLNSYWQQKALTKLMGLQYKICYKKGSSNHAADALSRVPHNPSLELYALSAAQPSWLVDLQESYKASSQAIQLLSKLSLQATQGSFSLVQGIIRYQGQIWLGHSTALQDQVMQSLPASAIGGHSGALVTYSRIKKMFYWPDMKKIIQDYVVACAVCQQDKIEKVPYPGLLQPLSVPDHAW